MPPGIAAMANRRGFLQCVGFDQRLVLRTIQTIQQTPPSRCPGESRDPLPPWAPAFAGEAGLSEVLGCLVNRVNDPED
jgi:hypothetical protein